MPHAAGTPIQSGVDVLFRFATEDSATALQIPLRWLVLPFHFGLRRRRFGLDMSCLVGCYPNIHARMWYLRARPVKLNTSIQRKGYRIMPATSTMMGEDSGKRQKKKIVMPP